MSQTPNNKQYNLEERTFQFARDCRDYVKGLPKTISNIEYGKQLIRSSGSQAANYIEANETKTKKDFLYRVRVSKKETKESRLWLRLSKPLEKQKKEQARLLEECNEIMKIFGSIIEKSK